MSKKECMKEIKWAIDACLDDIKSILDRYGYSYDVDLCCITDEFDNYMDFKKYNKDQAKFLLLDIIDQNDLSKKGINKFGKYLTDNVKISEAFHNPEYKK